MRIVQLLPSIGFVLTTVLGGRSTPPGLHVEVREERYVLRQSALSEVIQALNAMRLEGGGGPLSQGLTTYRIEPHWEYTRVDGRCAVTRVDVDVDIVVKLPGWEHLPGASEADREVWGGILDAIRAHEYEHRDRTIEAAGDLLNRLLFLRAGSCPALLRAADRSVSTMKTELDASHAELDARVDGSARHPATSRPPRTRRNRHDRPLSPDRRKPPPAHEAEPRPECGAGVWARS